MHSIHTQKKILLDTMILCYAHGKSSPNHAKAFLILKAAINGLIEACISYQNLAEFYSIITGKRVKEPLTPSKAAALCILYGKSSRIKKLLPAGITYDQAFYLAQDHLLTDGDVFDGILACTARMGANTIWTENVQHFTRYSFLNAENPLEWVWEER